MVSEELHRNIQSRYKLLIFDADGTIRKCLVPGQPCPNKSNQWALNPNVKETFALYNWSKTCLGIASNQAGIALGYVSENDAVDMLKQMVIEATGRFPPLGAIRVCPDVDEHSRFRKPNPGMLFQIMDSYMVDCHHTLMIGDMESDRQAAENVKCDFMWAKHFFGWE